MKVKSFIKFLLDHFDEEDNIEVSQAYGDCSLRKLENDESDNSFIWITNKYDRDNESYYHGEMIENRYGTDTSVNER